MVCFLLVRTVSRVFSYEGSTAHGGLPVSRTCAPVASFIVFAKFFNGYGAQTSCFSRERDVCLHCLARQCIAVEYRSQ